MCIHLKKNAYEAFKPSQNDSGCLRFHGKLVNITTNSKQKRPKLVNSTQVHYYDNK